jgi:hypothetical protein
LPKYIITSKAGRRVAGRRNGGVGTALDLTEAEAAEALDSGELHLPGSEEKAAKPAKAAKAAKAEKKDGGGAGA